ncbi:MAG: hypothetical protein C4570_01225 [Ammonifex sp.]|nr:MAG: hypothetical protein C4570_01225 [Ammonifex sp.]
MDLEEALQLLRAQYHDFLNCLQVISGMAELGRPEKIRDYVRRAADEFEARGRLAKVGLPAVAWGLLLLQMEAVPAGLKVSCTLEPPVKRIEFGNAAVFRTLHAALLATVSGTGEDFALNITGENVSGGYALTYTGTFDWAEVKKAMGGIAEASALPLEFGDENEMVLFLPAGEA